MTPEFERLLLRFNRNLPVDPVALRSFESESHTRLPDDYVRFLHTMNGGQGFIGDNAYVMEWPVEQLLQLNTAYRVAEYAPGLFLFASDGGGEAFASDTRVPGMPVVSIPFVGMDLSLVQPLAPNFTQFLEALAAS